MSIEEEEYTVPEHKTEFVEEEAQFELANPIIGSHHSTHLGSPSVYGIGRSTVAEGELGAQLRAISKKLRTPEEIFIDAVQRVSNLVKIEKGIVNTVISHTDDIPNINFKSPSGILLGWVALPFYRQSLKGDLKKADKIKYAKEITARIDILRENNWKVNISDPIRYAKFWHELIKS